MIESRAPPRPRVDADGLDASPGQPARSLNPDVTVALLLDRLPASRCTMLYGGAIRNNPSLLEDQAHSRTTQAPSVRGYVNQVAALRRRTSLPWLHKIISPTPVIAGDEDPITPLSNARVLTNRIPDSRLHVIKNGGHLCSVYAPKNWRGSSTISRCQQRLQRARWRRKDST